MTEDTTETMVKLGERDGFPILVGRKEGKVGIWWDCPDDDYHKAQQGKLNQQLSTLGIPQAMLNIA